MRLFIGIQIPQNIRASIYAQSMRMQQLASGKYVREDMYHITLAYIGESDEAMKLLAIECMKSAAQHACNVILSPGIPGYFGKPEKSILHLTVDGGNSLTPVSDELRRQLSAANLPYDPKPLVPHITLARNVAVTDALLSEIYEHVPFVASGLTLFNSCRIDDKLCYVPLEFISFKGASDYEA